VTDVVYDVLLPNRCDSVDCAAANNVVDTDLVTDAFYHDCLTLTYASDGSYLTVSALVVDIGPLTLTGDLVGHPVLTDCQLTVDDL
jgi:hypothetical protein